MNFAPCDPCTDFDLWVWGGFQVTTNLGVLILLGVAILMAGLALGSWRR
jgi:hypothetical protein